MPNSYTTLWTNDLCRELERSGYTGQRLTMLFGGPHQSLPSFQRAGVQPGDRIYPVRVHRTRLYVLGMLEVAHIVPYENVVSGDGHYWIGLDYRACGELGEPSVTWFDADSGAELPLAADFRAFVEGLQPLSRFG